ncbi:MAG: carbonic anhydrase, partial [Rhodothermales bacterium]|nr:carbonic anhydrase [Rhodothermales bacterium]
MESAAEALARLKEGNLRFVEEGRLGAAHIGESRRAALARGQEPFAIVLGCADSRVPPELVFDQGLGDLFVVRVAGNVVTPTVVGSIEYAAGVVGTRLVVVLGHSSCGAVKSTIEHMRSPTDLTGGLDSIVGRIRPSVSSVRASHVQDDDAEILRESVRENVRQSVRSLSAESSLLQGLILEDGLQVVGAEYS